MNESLPDLNAFAIVAREGSFTRAAAQMNVSQSALSQTIRGLERRLGIRLFHRTTRSLSLTEAGQTLLQDVEPALERIANGLNRMQQDQGKIRGVLRVSADDFAIETVLWPLMTLLTQRHPEVRIELISDYTRVDLPRDGSDVGVRRGKLVAKDMLGLEIGSDNEMALVASPGFVARHGSPASPQDVASFKAISMRLPTNGEIFNWRFTVEATEIICRPRQDIVFSSIFQARKACLEGMGLCWLPAAFIASALEDGKLVELLPQNRYKFEPYFLYYPSRHEKSPPLAAFLTLAREQRFHHSEREGGDLA